MPELAEGQKTGARIWRLVRSLIDLSERDNAERDLRRSKTMDLDRFQPAPDFRYRGYSG